MSDYNRKFWKNSPETPITAEDLNNIEEGVENLYKNFEINNPNLLFNISNRIYFTPTTGELYNGYGNCYYYKIGTKVHVHIGMKIDANDITLIYRLPEGYRPNSTIAIIGFGYTSIGDVSKIQINSQGDISVYDGGGYVLADIEYDAIQ